MHAYPEDKFQLALCGVLPSQMTCSKLNIYITASVCLTRHPGAQQTRS